MVSMPNLGARFVPMPIGSEILIFQDPSEADTWRVEYFDFKGDCYLTRFSGPAAERRARDYVLGAPRPHHPAAVSWSHEHTDDLNYADARNFLQSRALDQRWLARCWDALRWQ